MQGKTPRTTTGFSNIRNVYIITFLIAFVMLFILTCRGDFSILILIISPVFLLLIPISNKPPAPYRLINRNWLIVFVMLTLLIVIPELSLRLLNFNYESGVSYGNLEPRFTKYYVPDEKLMWKHSVDDPGVNSYGFYGPEIITPKPPRVIRILFFGDSCAEQNYARVLEQILNENNKDPDIKFECLVLAIAGYSSFQGRILAEKYAKTLEADLAIVCYGWNDHWLTFGNQDDEKYINQQSYVANSLIHHSKIMQLARKLTISLFKTDQKTSSDMVRVPINKYRDNICFITEKLKQSGTKSILLTAPTAFYFCGVPDYIVSTGLAHDKNSAITQHREYNEIIRDIAKNQNRHLLDAERIINKLKNPNGLFLEDRIHFSSSGLNYMADLIYSYLKGKQLI